MKYNIVLIPDKNDISEVLIKLAHDVSVGNGLEPDYLLKDIEQISIPHASVIQFEVEKNLLSSGLFGIDNNRLLETIWKQVSETWQEILASSDKKEMVCTLPQTINYKHDTAGAFAGMSWAEMVINKTANPWVQQFHERLYEKLAPLGIKCLNASGELYNPHFTLFNIPTGLLEQSTPIQELSESYKSILKSFSVRTALGVANKNWEFTLKLQEEKAEANINYSRYEKNAT